MAARDMPSFFIYMGLILVSFTIPSVLLFGKTSHLYRSFPHSMATMFTGILGNANFKVII